jgi:hypothetical protein
MPYPTVFIVLPLLCAVAYFIGRWHGRKLERKPSPPPGPDTQAGPPPTGPR